MASRSTKKKMRRMGVDNVKALKQAQGAAMAAGGVKMIEGSAKAREEKCLAAINRTCKMFDCVMMPEVTIGAAGIKAGVRIQAVPRDQQAQGPAIVS